MRITIKPTKILAKLAFGVILQLFSAWSLGEIYGIKCMIQDARKGHFIYQDKIKKENQL